MEIKEQNGTPVSEVKTLMQYFGRKDGQTLAEFNDEVKKLTPENKSELAALAAVELGYVVTVTE